MTNIDAAGTRTGHAGRLAGWCACAQPLPGSPFFHPLPKQTFDSVVSEPVVIGLFAGISLAIAQTL
jgi:hypothetical protein